MNHLLALARRHKRLAAASVIALGLLILVVQWATGPAQPAPAALAAPEISGEIAPELTNDLPGAASLAPTPEATLIVYISGAVQAPDVYQLPAMARIKDLVLAAGGLTTDADAEQINLAERLADGQHIHVPRIGEAAPADVTGQATDSGPAAVIDINTASAAELDGLDGIGQALAQRIVDYRSANGPFKSVEELGNVKGIGAALLEKLTPFVTVGR